MHRAHRTQASVFADAPCMNLWEMVTGKGGFALTAGYVNFSFVLYVCYRMS